MQQFILFPVGNLNVELMNIVYMGGGGRSGRVGSDFLSAIAGRVGSTFRGSGRVQEKWPVDNSDPTLPGRVRVQAVSDKIYIIFHVHRTYD